MPVQKRNFNKKRIIAVAILLTLCLVSLSLTGTILIIAQKQHRSSTSLFYESVLKVVLVTKDSVEGSYEDIEECRERNKDYTVPKIYPTLYNFDITTFNGFEVCVFGDENAQNTVLYLHGGAFMYQPLVFHYDYCKRLADTLGVKVYMPVYPKVPNYNHDFIMEFFYDYYLSLLQNISHENIVFMGDSAGATMIILLSQYLYDNNIPQPKEIFAFSPCSDTSLTNEELNSYSDLDPMLNLQNMQIKIGEFTGDTDPFDPSVNPYYCDFANLPTITAFVGGHELFLPDCRRLKDKLKAQDIPFNYYEYPMMNHTFAIFPMEESAECMGIIKNIWGI